MEQQILTPDLTSLRRLSNNDDFYNNVFKKTEKIISAVFYILSLMPATETSKPHRQKLTERTMSLHEVATAALEVYEHEQSEGLHSLKQSLVVLDSSLAVMTGARLLATTIGEPIMEEIDNVLRYIRHHFSAAGNTNDSGLSGLNNARSFAIVGAKRAVSVRRNRPQIPKNDMSSEAVLVYSDLSDRTTRIKTVLEAKPEATIKDLTDIITDVSAKTIQRDLNSLIESGEVMRQGERRWSKYSIATNVPK